MKTLLTVILVVIGTTALAQIPKSGTYIYDYCDMEYNKCLGKCKIKIKGNNIWIYAPANLSLIKEGELYERGTLKKTPSGKWLIITSTSKEEDGPSMWIDFKRKRFWTF
jgi:hypothetical protein